MSQTHPAPRPASYPASRLESNSGSLISVQHMQNDERSKSRLGNLHQQTTQSSNSIGMYSILNPPGRPSPQQGGVGPIQLPPRSWEHGSTRPSSTNPESTKIPRSFLATSSPPASMPASSAVTPSGVPTQSERKSPAASLPFPPTEAPRKILSPTSPRRSSNHRERLAEYDARGNLIGGAVAGAKRPYEHGPTEPHASVPRGHHGQQNGYYAHTAAPPSLPHGGPGRQPEYPRGPPAPVDAHGRPVPPYGPQHHGAPAPIQSTPETTSAWQDGVHRQHGPIMTTEGQHAYIQLPGSAVPIPIEVDYSHASRKADEKRQRNAKASTRHRRKKKTLQEETIRQLHELKEERFEISHQAEELARQRDFYKEERDRLRDLVARTPGISHHATGPPSPVLSTQLPPYPGHSPESQPRHGADGSNRFDSETPSVERQPTRQRSDEPAELHTRHSATLGANPTPLPPIHSTNTGVPPRPLSAASSAQSERLPSLRTIDGSLSHSELGPDQKRHSGQWMPAQMRLHETGFATNHRYMGDSHSR
ncbi:hypothetical protein VHEMI02091 [[Torrubiella] hemipterigena]|uniref:BZIP domain-containing protein n=1 Tax=[Torrubiella] hemipterigena TaxID=1531966 RepID=A0A0A1T6T6_9HYPO|nr:hypothetical protein VHEMI02091 [[Torrubiella] hemipterigena]